MITLQQAEQAYRAAPDAPTCQPHRSLLRANSEASQSTETTETLLLDSEEDEEEEEENLSWANFPVVTRTEQHPSLMHSLEWFLSQEEGATTTASPEAAQEENYADEHDQPEEALLSLKLSRVAADEAPPATFGWGDFPLVVQQTPSFDYPWRYLKADEKEEIVPLATSTPTHPPPSQCSSAPSSGEETLSQTKVQHHHQQQEQPQQRNVSFSLVRIREYAEILGDHPWCPQYPCSLDWRYDDRAETVVSVDTYEQARETCCWSSTPRRMDVLERRSRLARAMRVTRAEIDVMEGHRQEAAAQEKAAAEEAQQESCDSQHQQQPQSMHRVPTMIVLPEER